MSADKHQYYCVVDTGSSIVNTNLQLYSLHQAARYWNELVANLNDEDASEVECYKERLAFTLNAIGLSLSQLLGQNNKNPSERNWVPAPKELFDSAIGTDLGELRDEFFEFEEYYAAIRHFGVQVHGERYRKIDELDFQKLERFVLMAIKIWDLVIENYVEVGGAGSFRSIADTIDFCTVATSNNSILD